jgi:hypothetical protein
MPLSHNQEILFTRQRHEAERAGLHFDYRIVVGEKAYSWATKKPLPEPGKSILLHEQPVHTAHYALSERVNIPKGQYGAGVTTLDWVGKGRINNPEEDPEKFTVNLNDGQRFLIKKLPEKYGAKAWLFKNLTKEKPETIEKKAMENNKYLEKIANRYSKHVLNKILEVSKGAGVRTIEKALPLISGQPSNASKKAIRLASSIPENFNYTGKGLSDLKGKVRKITDEHMRRTQTQGRQVGTQSGRAQYFWAKRGKIGSGLPGPKFVAGPKDYLPK